MMTRAEHRSGTERVAEVAATAVHGGEDIFVNVQGDEPLIEPAAIDAAVEAIESDEQVSIATLAVAITRPADIMDPNIVKVVLDFDDNALYFSRAPIPWVRDRNRACPRAASEAPRAVLLSPRRPAGFSDAAAGRPRTHRAARAASLDGKRLQNSRRGNGARFRQRRRSRGCHSRRATASQSTSA